MTPCSVPLYMLDTLIPWRYRPEYCLMVFVCPYMLPALGRPVL